MAIARSWIASPVESKSVMSSARAAAVGLAAEHAADVRDPVARDDARLDACGQLAAVARLLPVVAEEVGAGELADRDLRLAGAVGAHHRDVLPVAQRSLGEEQLAARASR